MESRIASDCSSQKPSDTAIVCKGFCHHYGYGPLLLVHLKSLILTLVLLQHRVRGIMNKEAWLASAKSLRLLPWSLLVLTKYRLLHKGFSLCKLCLAGRELRNFCQWGRRTWWCWLTEYFSEDTSTSSVLGGCVLGLLLFCYYCYCSHGSNVLLSIGGTSTVGWLPFMRNFWRNQRATAFWSNTSIHFEVLVLERLKFSRGRLIIFTTKICRISIVIRLRTNCLWIFLGVLKRLIDTSSSLEISGGM